MYFSDIQIITVMHHYFPPAGKKLYFTTESNSLEFIRFGHVRLLEKRSGKVLDLQAPAFFWMHQDEEYLFEPVETDSGGKYIEHIYADLSGERSNRMIKALDGLYPEGMFHPADPEEVSRIFFHLLHLYRIDPHRKLPEIALHLENLMITAYNSRRHIVSEKRDAYDLERIAETLCSEPFGEYDFRKMALDRGLSVDHFRRLFREKHGVPPLEYLHRQRMIRAAELLEKTDLRIKEIVYSCHFRSDMDFSRKFKKYSGLSPRNYRKMYRT